MVDVSSGAADRENLAVDAFPAENHGAPKK